MRRDVLQKPSVYWTLKAAAALVMSGACLASLIANADASGRGNRLRADCRFYPDPHHFCYSSAVYNVSSRDEIDHVRFGVGCDYETIYDDGGTISPQEEVSDSIRPATAAIPRIELTPKGSLRHPGTYTSKLETDRGQILDGICYVREVDWDESEYDMKMLGWFFFQ
jgi:hypothetical protein